MNALLKYGDTGDSVDDSAEAVSHSAEKMSPGTSNALTGLAANLTGDVIGNVVGAATHSPTAGSVVGTGIKAGITGEDAVSSAARAGTNSILGQALDGVFGTFTGPAVGLANLGYDALAGEVTDPGPQIGQIAGTTIGGLIAGPFGGFFGGIIGSSFGPEISDAMNMRSFEDSRDRAEDQGYSRGDTQGMAAREGLRDSGYTGLGTSFDDANKGTPYGNLKDASVNALGDPSALGRGGFIGGLMGNDGPATSEGDTRGDFGDRESSSGGMGGV